MITIETKRLILRGFRESDADDLFEYASNPHVGPGAGWKPHTDISESFEALRSYIKHDDVWAIVYKKTQKVIGSFGLHQDVKRSNPKARMIGYVLSEEYWGRGLMTEAVREVLWYAFQKWSLDLMSVYHYPDNNRSRSVILKCGFQYEGTLRRSHRHYDGTIYDSLCYSITREEYVSRNLTLHRPARSRRREQQVQRYWTE